MEDTSQLFYAADFTTPSRQYRHRTALAIAPA